MAISKKGFRTIVVEGKTYAWKFKEKIVILNEEQEGSLLVVDFGWYDPWLYANDPKNKPPEFEPKTVTPKFVAACIAYALEQGWEKTDMRISFREGDFSLISS